MHVGQFDRAGVLAALVGGQPQRDHLRRIAGERLALEPDAAMRVADGVQALADIQPARVVRGAPIVARQVDVQVAERLIRPHRLVVAGPQRDVVELQALARQLAKDHRADAAVTDRQRLFFPTRRRVRRRLGVT